jgi:hypothetical protein
LEIILWIIVKYVNVFEIERKRMSRLYKVEVTGYVENDKHPQKQIQDWVYSLPQEWKDVEFIIVQRFKEPSKRGSSFEREFARMLSSWISSGLDKDVYWRTTGSGSFATRKRSAMQLGDIGCFPEKVDVGGWLTDVAVFELKNRALVLGDLFSVPFTWLSELIEKCVKVGVKKLPFVIMKSGGTLCTFTTDLVIRNLEINYFKYGEHFVFFDFRNILKIDPNIVKEQWEKLV